MQQRPAHRPVSVAARSGAAGAGVTRALSAPARRVSRNGMALRCMVVLSVMLLAACDPQQVADQAGRRVAATVVLPVVQADMPTPMARTATDCIMRNATAAEVQALARDVAAVAGTSTTATIRGIALRPETSACFAANGVPQVRP